MHQERNSSFRFTKFLLCDQRTNSSVTSHQDLTNEKAFSTLALRNHLKRDEGVRGGQDGVRPTHDPAGATREEWPERSQHRTSFRNVARTAHCEHVLAVEELHGGNPDAPNRRATRNLQVGGGRGGVPQGFGQVLLGVEECRLNSDRRRNAGVAVVGHDVL